MGEAVCLFRRSPDIQRLSKERNVAGLCRALADKDPTVRANAATALGDLRDPAAIEALIAVMSDWHELVPPRAIEALVQIHDSRVIDALLEMVSRPPSQPWGIDIDHAAVPLGSLRALRNTAGQSLSYCRVLDESRLGERRWGRA
jgi:HEAT repeat protein